MINRFLLIALILSLICPGVFAALTPFQTFTGNVGYSSDGIGSTSNAGTISASAPTGANVLGAFLYTSTFSTSSTPTNLTLAGQTVTMGPRVPNLTACCSLASFRADVTDIVKPIIDAGPGGEYTFNVNEGSLGGNIDGTALVVVFEHSSLANSTVGILDGFAEVQGATTSLNFNDPLDPSDPGFFAEMVLGIGFSCCNQTSTVDVNGTRITNNAGNFNDGNAQSNGSLFTTGTTLNHGGTGDAFSPNLPSYAQDTERYNLVPHINQGDTSVTITTSNASSDDNIFLSVIHTSGNAGVNEPPPPVIPEPSSFLLIAIGFFAIGRRVTKK